MGMYSRFYEQNIKVEDVEGIRAIKKIKGDSNFFASIIDAQNGTINFDEWSDCKVYGYLDKEYLDFLSLLAKFISGDVIFEYEEGWKFRFVFKDKKVYMQVEPKFIGWDNLPLEEIKIR